MELLEGMRNDCKEGNISWFPERQKTLINLIKKNKPHNIIEIGFNMGHSSLIICDTIVRMKQDGEFDDEPVTINIFDICNNSIKNACYFLNRFIICFIKNVVIG